MNFFLLDTNCFQAATKSPGNALLNTLVPALGSNGFEFGIPQQTAIRISPFALMEALGAVPSPPPNPKISLRGKDPKEIYLELFHYACGYFRKLPILQIDHLKRRHDEQITYLTPEGRALFETCISGILDRDIDLNGVLATFLAGDFFFKYPFSRDDFIAMGAFFGACFFSDVPAESPVSRFRVSLRTYDFIRESMRSVPGYEKQSKALRVKTAADYLDTDIIQDVTYGFPFQNVRHRVVALTFDDAEIVASRAALHRQVGWSMANKCTGVEFVRTVVRPFLDHPGGVIVQCDREGKIIKIVDLAIQFASVDARGTQRGRGPERGMG